MTTTLVFGVLLVAGTTAGFFLLERGLHRAAPEAGQAAVAQSTELDTDVQAEVHALNAAPAALSVSAAA